MLPSLALIVPLPLNRMPNKLAPKVSNYIRRDLPFYSLALFLIPLLMSFINNPNSSNYLTLFIASFILLFKIINVVTLDQNILLWIAASVADAATIYPNGIKTLLANYLIHFFKAIKFLVMVLNFHQEILLIVLF